MVMTSELGAEPVFFTAHASPYGTLGVLSRGRQREERSRGFVGKDFPILSEEEKRRYDGISTGKVMETRETEFSYFLNICISYSVTTVKLNLLEGYVE